MIDQCLRFRSQFGESETLGKTPVVLYERYWMIPHYLELGIGVEKDSSLSMILAIYEKHHSAPTYNECCNNIKL